MPAYVVFTDATLDALADPAARRDGALLAIPGIGAAKLERYGDACSTSCAGRAVSVRGARHEGHGIMTV